MQGTKRVLILFKYFFFCFIVASPNVFSQTNTPCTASTITATTIGVNLSCNFQSGTTVGATAQTTAANGGTPSCGSFGPDVWYSFVAPATATYQITGAAGTITDGCMAIYSGTCGAFTQLECSDDVTGTDPQITRSLVSGTRYLIRYWQYGGGTGTFNICVQRLVSLPLTLISFSGKKVGNKHFFNWETALEENTSHFELEKSMDGINFTFLTQTPAMGSGAHSYSTTDQQLQAGNNYYRLKSVDKDGSYTYSKTILLQVDANSMDKSLVIYPSISQKQIQVVAPAGLQGNAVINIYSMAGQKMTSTTACDQQPTTIDVSTYSSGTYIVEFVSNALTLRSKFIKIE